MTVKTKEVKKGKTATPTKSGETNTVMNVAKEAATLAERVNKTVEKSGIEREVRVEDRFSKFQEFQALQGKHERIQKKFQSLKVLRRSNDTMGAEICISAGSEEIRLNNGDVITEVLDLLNAKLQALHAETEKEVLNFEL